jgi:hypothetical protein
MIFFPSHGIRRHIPPSRRVARAVKGLDTAVERGRIFHLWFHPTNLAFDTDVMFDGLRQIFKHASGLRDAGQLLIKSMGEIVADQQGLARAATPQESRL